MDPKLKIIQISTCPDEATGGTCLYALDSAGDVWDVQWRGGEWKWVRVGSPFGEAE
jgi:hypothetical protein